MKKIVFGVMDHIKGILEKSNNDRLERSLQKIADESPEGKEAVDNLMKKIKATGNAVKKADDLMAKADIFS